MRRIHMPVAVLAGVLLVLPAVAAPNLAGTTWTDDECMTAFEFRADSSFLEYDVDDNERTGQWRQETGVLYLQYDGGGSVQTPVSDDLFELSYPYSNGERYTCWFTPRD